MAHEAEPRLEGGEPEPEKSRIDAVLRLLEGLLFCCLSALVLFWVADRLRGVDFEPVPVVPCVGAACAPYVGPPRGSPWSVFSDTLDATGVVSFSGENMCARLVETLEERGENAQGVERVVELMTGRGTIVLTPGPREGVLVVSPGPRNDSFGDVVRDAFRIGPARGCYPLNYKPVFWPLWAGWMLLGSWRLLRGRQAVWAKR